MKKNQIQTQNMLEKIRANSVKIKNLRVSKTSRISLSNYNTYLIKEEIKKIKKKIKKKKSLKKKKIKKKKKKRKKLKVKKIKIKIRKIRKRAKKN